MENLIKFGCINQLKNFLIKNKIEWNFFIEKYNPIENFLIKDKYFIKWIEVYVLNKNFIKIIKNKQIQEKVLIFSILKKPIIFINLLKSFFNILDQKILFSLCVYNNDIKKFNYFYNLYPNFDITFDEFFLLRRCIYKFQIEFIYFLLNLINKEFYMNNFEWNLLKKEFNILEDSIQKEITKKIKLKRNYQKNKT